MVAAPIVLERGADAFVRMVTLTPRPSYATICPVLWTTSLMHLRASVPKDLFRIPPKGQDRFMG
jgi:hypothetical protein